MKINNEIKELMNGKINITDEELKNRNFDEISIKKAIARTFKNMEDLCNPGYVGQNKKACNALFNLICGRITQLDKIIYVSDKNGGKNNTHVYDILQFRLQENKVYTIPLGILLTGSQLNFAKYKDQKKFIDKIIEILNNNYSDVERMTLDEHKEFVKEERVKAGLPPEQRRYVTPVVKKSTTNKIGDNFSSVKEKEDKAKFIKNLLANTNNKLTKENVISILEGGEFDFSKDIEIESTNDISKIAQSATLDVDEKANVLIGSVMFGIKGNETLEKLDPDFNLNNVLAFSKQNKLFVYLGEPEYTNDDKEIENIIKEYNL